jgi:tetratricopeptide (TPR) repeat protein
MALYLAHFHYERRNDAVSRGCSARAARLLADEPECAEHGLRASLRAAAALAQGDLVAARDSAEQARAIGRRLRDRDLEALGLLWLGHALLADGQIEEGIAFHDEATAAATSGELGPLAAGTVYCSVIFACRNRADWRRASEWTDVASRWCDRESIGYFPGLCSVHRAEVFRRRGAFDEAEQSALVAGDQLLAANPRMAGWAFQELAEVRLCRGDVTGASEACRRALELGQDPQPVLAHLRLAEGDAAGALRSIQRTLADPAVMSRENRVNLLPVLVSSALAARHAEAATQAADELESLAKTFGSPAPLASAAYARGEIELSAGRAAQAIEPLRRAWNLWTEAGPPYEAARAQSLLAAALVTESDEAAAILELEAASATFERLGAALDKGGAVAPRTSASARSRRGSAGRTSVHTKRAAGPAPVSSTRSCKRSGGGQAAARCSMRSSSAASGPTRRR